MSKLREKAFRASAGYEEQGYDTDVEVVRLEDAEAAVEAARLLALCGCISTGPPLR